VTKRTGRQISTAALRLAVAVGTIGVAGLALQAQAPNQERLEVLQVQPNFHMIAGAGGNIGVQVGPAGLVLVDAGSAERTEQVLAALRGISDKPIRYIINTSAQRDHVGGNRGLSKAGVSIISSIVGNAVFNLDAISNGGAASILAHDNVLARMSDEDSAQWPTKTYTARFYKMSLNGDGIEVFHQPSAHSDGDSIVLFRRSNVIVTGDVFDPRRFPVIRADAGGSIQGVLNALNHLLELTLPPYPQPWLAERTYVVPGHGRLSDSHDLLEYRDMVTIVRDRIQDLIDKGMTLEQVKAANPTLGYNARYGASTGAWTTDMFVTAVYQGLSRRAR
jgi:glyoxylase-like metal-dependent hydrolase (beta-lactamase superfamily II)